jgi:hypothetical protein
MFDWVLHTICDGIWGTVNSPRECIVVSWVTFDMRAPNGRFKHPMRQTGELMMELVAGGVWLA